MSINEQRARRAPTRKAMKSTRPDTQAQENRPPPRGRRERKLERQEDILAAAIAVISEKGYENARISDIADRAGVAYGLVYHYFGSKEKVLSSIFERLWERFGERITRIQTQDKSGVEKLAEVSDYMLDTLIARPDLIRLLVQEVVRARNFQELPKLDIVQRIGRMIEGIFAESIERGELDAGADPRFLSFAFFGAVEMTLTALAEGVYAPGKPLDLRHIKIVKKRMREFLYAGSFGRRPRR